MSVPFVTMYPNKVIDIKRNLEIMSTQAETYS